MKFYLIIFLVHTVCVAVNSENGTKVEANPRKVADGGQFPFQVSIRSYYTGQHKCGGAILNNRYILTTASCMYAQSITWTYAILGVLGKNDGGLKYNIENIKKHEMFHWNSNEYDIALLRTFKEMEFSFWIKPVGLPPRGWSESSDGLSYQMSGWTEKEDRLQYEEATLVPCKSSLSGKVVCAKMEDAFGFDPYSARLLSSKNSASGDYLMGILSHYQNSILDDADAYTRISSFRTWIEQNSKLAESMGPVKMILTLIFSLICLFVIVLLLVKCVKCQKRQRRTAAPTVTSLPTVSSISHGEFRPVSNQRQIISGTPERHVPSAPPSDLYPSTPPPPSYEALFPNKPEFSST